MQAGAMGLPSIVTNINGCNEIIKDTSAEIIKAGYDIKDSARWFENFYLSIQP